MRLLRLKREKKSLLIDILELPFYQQDTSQDPYRLNIKYFLEEANKLENYRILHLGSWNEDKRSWFRGYEKYVGFDIHAGKGVDVVGDCHHLSQYFPEEYFDVAFSIMVFEHIAMPWKVITELNKVLKAGGLLFIATVTAWPPHALPWDFWRYTKESFKVLLNPYTGFELLRSEEGLPCAILPFGYEPPMIDMHKLPAHLGVNAVARKINPYADHLNWNLDIVRILNTMYPENHGIKSTDNSSPK